MNVSQNRMLRRGAKGFMIAIALAAMAGAGMGQQPQHQLDSVPPPVKVISSLEREQLNASKDAKARIKTSIILAEAHLTKAEAFTAERDFSNASSEAARYWAIIENAFAHLRTTSPNANKVRDLYKRLELALRAHGPRLTGLRRTTPSEYAVWIKEIEDNARKGRTEALNSFYGETVVRDGHQTPELKPNKKPLQENLASPSPTP